MPERWTDPVLRRPRIERLDREEDGLASCPAALGHQAEPVLELTHRVVGREDNNGNLLLLRDNIEAQWVE